MIEIVTFKGTAYPVFQAQGNASRFAIPFAQEVCRGSGYDIGYGKDEWKLPGATGVDMKDGHDAMDLPPGEVDYIYSSHCLEHLPSWIDALDHWTSRLKSGGVLFLYLPHFDQQYWRPWHNRQHKHVLTAEMISAYLRDGQYRPGRIFVSERDLNHSFMVMAEKL
jgi:predicted SAM-dependent methyltransferase